MKKLFFIITLFFVMTLWQCSSQKAVAVKPEETCVPSWYLSPPHSPDTVWAVNSAISSRMQIAIDKATMNARTNVAQQINVIVKNLMKSYEEEVSTEVKPVVLSQYSGVAKHVASASLQGSYVVEQKICQKGDFYEAYVKVAYPLHSVKKQLLQQIKNKQELYTRWRASQAFRELENEFKK